MSDRGPTTAKHVAGLIGAALLALILVFVSRFWPGPGVFGLDGDLLREQLGGTWAQDFDLVIWGCGAVLVLSLAQVISHRLSR